jgi:hypothetical protein
MSKSQDRQSPQHAARPFFGHPLLGSIIDAKRRIPFRARIPFGALM